MANYPFIEYHCNDENLGPDKNIEKALKYADTDYVWLLGDTYVTAENGINYVLDLISKNDKKYDAIIVNCCKRIDYLMETDYSDQNQVLSNLGWHMTMLAVYIYNLKIIANGNCSRYYYTNFLQMGIFFEYISGTLEFIQHLLISFGIGS